MCEFGALFYNSRVILVRLVQLLLLLEEVSADQLVYVDRPRTHLPFLEFALLIHARRAHCLSSARHTILREDFLCVEAACED